MLKISKEIIRILPLLQYIIYEYVGNYKSKYITPIISLNIKNTADKFYCS